jgi:hypothetical protein
VIRLFQGPRAGLAPDNRGRGLDWREPAPLLRVVAGKPGRCPGTAAVGSAGAVALRADPGLLGGGSRRDQRRHHPGTGRPGNGIYSGARLR